MKTEPPQKEEIPSRETNISQPWEKEKIILKSAGWQGDMLVFGKVWYLFWIIITFAISFKATISPCSGRDGTIHWHEVMHSDGFENLPKDVKTHGGDTHGTLQGIKISHLGKRKIIFKMPFFGDMLVPWRVRLMSQSSPF